MISPQDLAYELIGTCAIADPGERLETQADVEAFDQLAFECHGCGWWCSTEELNNETDDNLCDDCVNEKEAQQ